MRYRYYSSRASDPSRSRSVEGQAHHRGQKPHRVTRGGIPVKKIKHVLVQRGMFCEGIGKLFSSPLVRARETAEIISVRLGVSLEIKKDLREQNRYGILTGMTKQEAAEKFPDQVKLLKDRYSRVRY